MGKRIIKFHNPSIILDRMELIDYDYGVSEGDLNNEKVKYEKVVGTLSPYIQMNGMKYGGELIEFLELEIGQDLLPTLRFSFKEVGGQFMTRNYLRDGDLVSLYLASNNDYYKPIRMDFTPISLNSTFSGKNNNNIYTCDAILRIPSIYGEFPELYTGTSFEVLRQISKNLNLGFSSNIKNSNDSMNWINPYETRKNFIQDIILHSYIDDKSFTTCFVDQFYYLNYLNVNDLLVLEDDILGSITNQIVESEYRFNDSFTEKFDSPFFLTNSRLKANEPNFIMSYRPISDNGQVSLVEGYSKNIQYYDKKTMEYVTYSIEPLDTDGADPSTLMRGRVDDDKNDLKRYEYLGVQSENVHDNYLHSRVQNLQNHRHNSRMKLEVELATINQSVTVGSIVPIFIIEDNNEMNRDANFDDPDDGDKEKQGTMSLFLSGYYCISKMKYRWDKYTNKLDHVITGIKREWENMSERRQQTENQNR